jgi:hypothetical protein
MTYWWDSLAISQFFYFSSTSHLSMLRSLINLIYFISSKWSSIFRTRVRYTYTITIINFLICLMNSEILQSVFAAISANFTTLGLLIKQFTFSIHLFFIIFYYHHPSFAICYYSPPYSALYYSYYLAKHFPDLIKADYPIFSQYQN